MSSNPWKLDPVATKLLEKVEEIATKVVEPMAQETDRTSRFPEAAISALREAGLLSLVSSKEMGGQGQGIRAASAVCERLARVCPSTAMITQMHYCGAAVVEKFGSEALRKSIAKEGKLTTLAFSESGSRSHFWIPVSTAERCSEGIKLNAAKQLITSAGHADIYVWSSRPAKAEGLSSVWAVPAKSKGLTLGQAFDGLGLRGNSSAPIQAKDVIISEGNQLGEDGKGFDVMMSVVMPFFSLQNCAVSLGMMEGVVAATVKHVTHSKFGYDSSALTALPQVRGHIGKMRMKTDLIRGFLLDGFEALENNRGDAMLRVLESKVAGSETSLEVHDLAMRVCGGAAFRKDTSIERYFRDSRAAVVMAPVSDALYDFIGKAACGMPVFG